MSDVLEGAIFARGATLLESVRPQRLIALSPGWWQERLMAWASSDPDFRTKLLRFVDVLPALRTSSAVGDHLREYFRDDRREAVRAGASVAQRSVFRPVVSRVVRAGVFGMAERFIGAPDGLQALPLLRKLLDGGTAYSIDLLGEATLSEGEADTYAERYIELIHALTTINDPSDPIRQANVSVKLSALTPHLEPAAPERTSHVLAPRLLSILKEAAAAGVFINVDMEQHRYCDLVHQIVADVATLEPYRNWPNFGVVVQAYLRDAPETIARLAGLARGRGTPITVRLVKGAYWDEEVALAQQEGRQPPVFLDKEATDASYERCTAALVAAYPHLRPAFGTHNPRSIAQAMVRAEGAGVPRGEVEFQMLFGMAEGLRTAVQEAGYRTRVYVPAGAVIPGMAYLVRRLLENTSNESWLLHRHEEGSPEDLLRQPVAAGAPEPADRPHFVNATPAQFHEPAVREAMKAAISETRMAQPARYRLYLGGREVEAHAADEVRSPADPSSVLGTVDRAELEHVKDAVGFAKAAFPQWRDTPVEQRAEILRNAAGLLADRRFQFAALMVLESAKPWGEADGDVIEAIDYLRYYADEAERLSARATVWSPLGEKNRYFYEGRGVAVAIAPWNFPLAIITGMSAAALAAGCTVILKPAEQSPIVAAKLTQLLAEAGAPAGVVTYLPGPGETVGKALVEHPDTDVIAFTGSNAVGLEILRASAVVRPGQRNLKKLVLEMGGKNAIIVDEDADIDQAVEGVISSAFGYAGQKCSACSRVVVVGSAYQEFRARLGAAVEGLVVGPPDDPFTQVPPVISEDALDRINRAIADGHVEGSLVARADFPSGHGWYAAPHVFENVPTTSSLARREIFGPLLLLFRADSFQEALTIAFDSEYALTGGVFSRHPRHIEAATREFRVGNLYINRKISGATVGRQPFGGMRMSGGGDKAGGPDYLLNFVVPRTVTENTMRRGFASAD